MSDPVRRLMEFECRRARDFYRRAVDAMPAEDRRRLVAAEIMRAVYFETLNRIELSGIRRLHLARPGSASDPGDHRPEAVRVAEIVAAPFCKPDP
jgi:hypothetical protein